MEITLPIILMFILLAFGMPVGFAMGFSGIIGLYLVTDVSILNTFLSQEAYSAVASHALTTVPLFILMGELIASGGIARDLFTSLQKFMGRLPGGVAMTTVLTSAGFGSMSGSTTAAAASLSRITMPEFRRLNYDTGMAGGVVAVAGTLAIMIPPSVPMIIYGVATQNSIGQLLMAGLIPGVLTATIYIIGIFVWGKLRPGILPDGEAYSWREKFASLKNLWGFVLIVSFVMFALYGGIATPTEIAALAAFFSLVMLIIMRRLTWSSFLTALQRTLNTTAMIFVIIIGAMIFAKYLTITQITNSLLEWVNQLPLGTWGILAIIVLIYLLLGMVMDQIAILLITLPFTYPMAMEMGMDPLWFGVIVIKLVEIGLVTPPVGLNAFIVSGASKVPIEKVFKGIGMMLVLELITLIILFSFPGISTWLPSIMNH